MKPARSYARAVRTLSRPSPAHLAALAAAKVRCAAECAKVDAIFDAGGIDAVRKAYADHCATRGTPAWSLDFGAACIGYLRKAEA